MKKTIFLFILLLFVISMLYLPTNYAQDPLGREGDMPEGAKVRISLSHDVITHRTEKPFYETPNAVESVVFSPDGHTLATASDRSPIHLWNATTGEYMQTLRKHTAEIVNLYRENTMAWNTRTSIRNKPYGSN